MRLFIRHPSDVPIDYQLGDRADTRRDQLSNFSEGGLCFVAKEHIEPGAEIHFAIPIMPPQFHATGVVVWCRRLPAECHGDRRTTVERRRGGAGVDRKIRRPISALRRTNHPAGSQTAQAVSVSATPVERDVTIRGNPYAFAQPDADRWCRGRAFDNRVTGRWLVLLLWGLFGAVPPAVAGDIVTVKRLSPDLAVELVRSAVQACRDQGYQVTAVVVAADGAEVALMRDVKASRFTIQIARDKANAVILSGVASGVFRENRQDIRQEMNHVDGILVLQGGLPIEAAGYQLGAIGVSGAPGGDRDEACARKALEGVRERLEFAE
ncbi:MAG: heme-binding protein [Candidatus Thiodiazotropha sp.]